MKICWDNLEDVYLSTRGNLRHKNTTYVEVEGCKICGESFLQARTQDNDFCSRSCAQIGISDEHREKLSK